MNSNNPAEVAGTLAIGFVVALQEGALHFANFLTWWFNLHPAHWGIPGRVGAMFGETCLLALLVGHRLRPFYRWVFRQIFGGGGLFGSARFASLREMRKAGMLKPDGRFVGQFKGKDLFLHGEGHCLTIAAQGGGKTTGLIIPTLLTYTRGPVIVTDPKGAITAQMKRARSSYGINIILNPWREELALDPSFGVDLGDDGFNPLQAVTRDNDGLTAARTIAGLLMPDMPGEDAYWKTEGRGLLEWSLLAMTIAAKPADQTLPYLHRLLFDYPAFLHLLESTAKSSMTGFGMDTLRLGASRLYGIHKANPGQLAGVVGMATTALQIYAAETRLAAHVSKDGFKLADLKSDKLPGVRTVFVICPPNHLVGDDRKWLNLVLALIAQQIGKPGQAVETVLLMDEFPALGYLPNLMGALEQFRESGLRAHLIAQNPGQIVNIYGADGLTRLWGACENKQFFRITDPNHARLISEWLGQRTERQFSVNAKGEKTESLVGVPLIRPDELMQMPKDQQIFLRPEMRPIKARVLPFFKRREWATSVDPNPYRGQ